MIIPRALRHVRLGEDERGWGKEEDTEETDEDQEGDLLRSYAITC